MQRERKTVWRAAAIIYILLMFYLLLGQRVDGASGGGDYWRRVGDNLNLIPFASIRCFLDWAARSERGVRAMLVNLVGNVAAFIPLGIFLPHFRVRLQKFGRFTAAAAGIIVGIETVQLLTLLGSGDIDDLLLNLPGAMLGFGLWKIIQKRKKQS
jgi:glycopeptide antibiotics resistance protein